MVEREAGKVLADEHKADHLLAEERDAQTAQAPTPEQRQQAIQQAVIAALADLKAKMDALKSTGSALTNEEMFKLQALNNQFAQLFEQLDGAQLDTLKAVALVSPTSP